MKTIQLVLLLILATSSIPRANAEEGFIDLFNGKNLDGWVNVNCAANTWQTSEGAIHSTGKPTGLLRTKRMYQDFILELEWRHLKPQGNAGVFVWADPLTTRAQPFARGIEVQVLDGQEGDWFTSDGDIFPVHGARMKPENGRGGDRAFPTEKRVKPSPEWNKYRIECIGGAIALAVNGKVVTRGNSASPRKGYICLESEGSPTEFRNIRIKELSSKTALSPEEIAMTAEGFEPLYNGIDLEGWKVTPELAKHWKPSDWIIEQDGDREGDQPNLWTKKEYGDFVLIADWCWGGEPQELDELVILPDGSHATNPDGTGKYIKLPCPGDSGIFLRGSLNCEVNIWCNPIGSGEVYAYREDVSMPPEVRAGVTPKLRADEPIGSWNRFMITMRGDRLTVVLNGKTVIENARLPNVPARGAIALQHHSGAIKFANVFIKELD